MHDNNAMGVISLTIKVVLALVSLAGVVVSITIFAMNLRADIDKANALNAEKFGKIQNEMQAMNEKIDLRLADVVKQLERLTPADISGPVVGSNLRKFEGN